MYTPIQHFEMEIQLKMNKISGLQSKTNNTASTLVIQTQNVYKGILKLSINYHCKDVCLDFHIACHIW
jgi:hypothetical protein